MLAEVEQKTANGPAVAAWLGTSRMRFERLLARAKRQRNGLAHGRRALPGVVATVEPMLDYLAGRRWRLIRLQKLDALAGGAPPQSLVEWAWTDRSRRWTAAP